MIRICLFIALLFSLTNLAEATTKMIIAEYGAGKDLLEHSLPAATLAAAKGVEYLELHVVMTADDQLVVFHDLTLDRLTDVATIFPDRKRDDGAYYVIDFTMDELRRLRLVNSARRGEFPLTLGIPSLAEELGLLRHLETILQLQIGIILEIRQPWFHLQAGKDIAVAILDTLARFKYNTAQDKLYLQCFDPDELQRVHGQLMPERKMNLPLVQLIGENDGLETKHRNLGALEPFNYDWLFTNIGLRMVASYAVAIALPAKNIADSTGNLLLAGYIGEAHRHGLKVLLFSLNRQGFPTFAPDFPALVDFYFSRAGVDGLYTDSFSDLQRHIQQQSAQSVVEAIPVNVESPQAIEELPQPQNDLPPFFKNLNLSRPTPANSAPEEQQRNTLSE